MIFTAFSEHFLLENKLCGWLFTDLHNTYAFSWPLANFPDFPLAKKNHISFIIIYITIYIVAFPWLCLSMITLSLIPIVPEASNNVQTIGIIIWKCYPDDRKWPGGLRQPLLIPWIELGGLGGLGGSCKFWSDLEMLSDDWDYQDDQRLSQKSSLSFH